MRLLTRLLPLSVLILMGLTTTALAEEPCEETGYDSCEVIDADEMVSWQTSIDQWGGAPPWRAIHVDKYTNTVHVVFDPAQLNTGLIYKDANSGRYDSQESFLHAKQLLLGVDVEAWHNEGFQVSIEEVSRADYVTDISGGEEGRIYPGFDDFVVDALSDLEGNVEVGGEIVAFGLFTDTTPCFGFGAGPWAACFQAKIRKPAWPFVRQELSTRTRQFTRNGKTTTKTCKKLIFFRYGCETNKIKADIIEIKNKYIDTRADFGQGLESWVSLHEVKRSKTDYLSLGRTGNFYGGICGKSRVKDSGREQKSTLIDKDLGGFASDPCTITY